MSAELQDLRQEIVLIRQRMHEWAIKIGAVDGLLKDVDHLTELVMKEDQRLTVLETRIQALLWMIGIMVPILTTGLSFLVQKFLLK